MQVAQIERKGYAGFRDFDVAGKQIRLAADAVGQQRAVEAVADGLRRLLVHVDGGVARHAGGKQQLLGREIVVHRAEEVEVILREVCVGRRLKHHADQLAQIQRVGGNLHAHDLHARVGHDAQNFKHFNRVRRGQMARQLRLTRDAARRADNAAAHARAFNDALEQVGRGRLALRAGHAHKLHPPLRVAVKRAGDARHRGAHVGHDHLRAVDGQLALYHQRHAAACDGLRREIMRIHAAAPDAEEQAVFAFGARIRRQGFDFRLRVPRDFDQLGHARRQLFKVHRHSSICCLLYGISNVTSTCVPSGA